MFVTQFRKAKPWDLPHANQVLPDNLACGVGPVAYPSNSTYLKTQLMAQVYLPQSSTRSHAASCSLLKPTTHYPRFQEPHSTGPVMLETYEPSLLLLFLITGSSPSAVTICLVYPPSIPTKRRGPVVPHTTLVTSTTSQPSSLRPLQPSRCCHSTHQTPPLATRLEARWSYHLTRSQRRQIVMTWNLSPACRLPRLRGQTHRLL